MVKEGEKEGVKLDSAQLAISKDLIKLQIKAMLARDIWDTSEYYKIMNVENPIYNKGVIATFVLQSNIVAHFINKLLCTCI